MPGEVGAHPHDPAFSVRPEEIILSAKTRARLHLPYFPDGSIGVLRARKRYYFFASNGGPNVNPKLAGTIRLGGTLDRMTPDVTDRLGNPIPSLQNGLIQQEPNRDDFDRNYAGGGPVYLDKRSERIFHFYHGEYHPNGDEKLFYSAIGLAVSNDWGKTFRKIGKILSPNAPRRLEFLPLSIADASVVARGADLYAFYTDRSANPNDGPCYKSICIAVARARVSALRDFAYGKTKESSFRKYYVDSTSGVGGFTQPGVGGKFTALITARVESGKNYWPGRPFVAYDEYIRRYILAYLNGTYGINLSTSTDLIHWSRPVLVVSQSQGVTSRKGTFVQYPTLIGTGGNPSILGRVFYLYYVGDFPNWKKAVLARVEITVNDSLNGPRAAPTQSP